MAKQKWQPDPFDVYYFAVCYNKSVARLEEQAQKHPYGIACVVLQTLSVEVFLKCVYRLRGQDIPRLHDLTLLFTNLPQSDQDTLSEMFAAISKARGESHNLALINVLEHSKDLFESIRYAYEDDRPVVPGDSETKPVNLGLNSAILAIRDFIKLEKPDYGPRAEALHDL